MSETKDESLFKILINFFKFRKKQFGGLVLIFLFVFLISFFLNFLPCKKFHIIAHSLILIAIIFNFLNTFISLWFQERVYKKAFRSFLICAIFLIVIIIIYIIALILIFIVVKDIGKMENYSNDLATYINLPILICAMIILYSDVKEGLKKLAWQVDIPFIIGVSSIFLFTFILQHTYDPIRDYSLGIGSGGLAFQLIVANMMAPGGKLEEDT